MSDMSNESRLRNVEPEECPIFFEQQLDTDATRMAGLGSRDRTTFDAHWTNNIRLQPRTRGRRRTRARLTLQAASRRMTPPNSGLQPTWPVALPPSKLCHHCVAGTAAEPWR